MTTTGTRTEAPRVLVGGVGYRYLRDESVGPWLADRLAERAPAGGAAGARGGGVEFDAAVAELDALVRTLEREGDARALLLLELVDAIHRPALERLARGETDDPQVAALLAMYDLAPVPDEVLVQ